MGKNCPGMKEKERYLKNQNMHSLSVYIIWFSSTDENLSALFVCCSSFYPRVKLRFTSLLERNLFTKHLEWCLQNVFRSKDYDYLLTQLSISNNSKCCNIDRNFLMIQYLQHADYTLQKLVVRDKQMNVVASKHAYEQSNYCTHYCIYAHMVFRILSLKCFSPKEV